jgi:hypothetical protein
MLVQVYGNNYMKETAVYKWVTRFSKEEKVSLTKRGQDGQRRGGQKKTLQKFVKLCVEIVGCQKHGRTSKHRQRNRKILTEDPGMRKVCAKMFPKDMLTWDCL